MLIQGTSNASNVMVYYFVHKCHKSTITTHNHNVSHNLWHYIESACAQLPCAKHGCCSRTSNTWNCNDAILRLTAAGADALQFTSPRLARRRAVTLQPLDRRVIREAVVNVALKHQRSVCSHVASSDASKTVICCEIVSKQVASTLWKRDQNSDPK